MGKNWYQDLEDDLDERNEAIGRAFVAAINPELVATDPEPARSEPVQLSIFGDEEKEVKEETKNQNVVYRYEEKENGIALTAVMLFIVTGEFTSPMSSLSDFTLP